MLLTINKLIKKEDLSFSVVPEMIQTNDIHSIREYYKDQDMINAGFLGESTLITLRNKSRIVVYESFNEINSRYLELKGIKRS